jgi:arsenate reductase
MSIPSSDPSSGRPASVGPASGDQLLAKPTAGAEDLAFGWGTRSGAEHLADSLRLLADPVRLRILFHLAQSPGREACACELPGAVERAQPTVSHHLSALTEAGLLSRTQRGKWAWFRLEEERWQALVGELELPEVRVPTVLFLCVHNAGRSQMAAAWLRALGGERVRVLSAGSAPAESVNPAAVEVMSEVGIDLAAYEPQRWTDAMVEQADVVVSMGCGDRCPVLPATRYLDWALEDPAGQGADAVRVIRDQIRERVEGLLAELLGAEGCS